MSALEEQVASIKHRALLLSAGEGAQTRLGLSSPGSRAITKSGDHWTGQILRWRRVRETRYEELFETAEIGIVAVDLAGRIVDCNPAYLRLLGYESLDQLRGMSIWELTPPEYHQIKGQIYHATFEHGRGERYEQEYIRKSGDRLPVAIRSWPRRDRHGRVIGAWAMVRDLSQDRLLWDTSDPLAEQRLLGELAAAINHEVRNPLTTVRGFLQFFARDTSFSDQHRELFQIMIGEIDSAVEVMGDLLGLARPERPKRQTFSLSRLLETVVVMTEGVACLRHVVVTAHIQKGLNTHGDPAQIRLVFLHLVENALEAMLDGGALVIEARRESDHVDIRITDTGLGIPRELMPRLGRPFFTTKLGHTGLGIASCQRILSLHQGHIEVISEPGRGTTVQVILPIAGEAGEAGSPSHG